MLKFTKMRIEFSIASFWLRRYNEINKAIALRRLAMRCALRELRKGENKMRKFSRALSFVMTLAMLLSGIAAAEQQYFNNGGGGEFVDPHTFTKPYEIGRASCRERV